MPDGYRDKETLERLYYQEDKSLHDIAEEFGVTAATIMKWMERNNLPRRERIEGIRTAKGSDPVPVKYHSKRGCLVWRHRHENNDYEVPVHRLAAVAWFGIDEVVGKDVHHIDGVPWHNSEDNLLPITREEHARLHEREKVRNEQGQIIGVENATGGGLEAFAKGGVE